MPEHFYLIRDAYHLRPVFFERITNRTMEITRDTVIGEIVENCPEAMPVFQEIGMHCIGCALASGETIEQACAVHGVDPDEFLNYLTEYLKTV